MNTSQGHNRLDVWETKLERPDWKDVEEGASRQEAKKRFMDEVRQ